MLSVDVVNIWTYVSTMTRSEPRPYHHGNLRQALLNEADRMIRSSGVEGLTLRRLGARVGVSRSALYRHFADKRALLIAVATDGFRSLREKLVEAWERGGRNPEAFRAMGAAYVEFAVRNPSHYRVMFGGFLDPEARNPELVSEGGGAFQALVDAIATLQRDGYARLDNPVLLARHAWAVVHGVAMFGIDAQLREPGALEELAEFSIEQLRAGLARTRKE